MFFAFSHVAWIVEILKLNTIQDKTHFKLIHAWFFSTIYMKHFWFIFSDENKYDLVSYWNATGLTGQEITALYQKTLNDQLALLYLKEQEKGGEMIDAVKKVLKGYHARC